MARTSILVQASADDVWAELADPWTYANWVVGTVKIRDADRSWPVVGSRLHHAVGAWPLLLQDETEVVACEPLRRLRLQARGWPAGEATVELTLHAEDARRTRVEMFEKPTSGPGAWLDNPLLDGLGTLRLAETLDRLRRLVEGHRRDGSGRA